MSASDHRAATYLPASSWPTSREPAPGGLELVRRFCNTRNPENGVDRLATTIGFADWLEEIGRSRARVTSADIAALAALRDAIRSLSHNPPNTTSFRRAVAQFAFTVRADADGTVHLSGRGTATALAAELIDLVIGAQHDGTWHRFKLCANCRWTFYDHSKNASGRWCTMNACGQRLKAKAYRDRVRQAAAST